MPAKKQPAKSGVVIAHEKDKIPEGQKILWAPHPGPQTFALTCNCFEILYGGAKGGGKTAAGIIWLLKGNPGARRKHIREGTQCQPVDISYINHAHYRALVLRKNLTDLGDWIDKARRIYEPMGAIFRERPLPMFEFPMGAKIILGHLDDSDAFGKYQGQEFQRLLLEEATLIPEEKSYLMVMSCIRSVTKGLNPQIFLTSNPGGAGHAWVRGRFVKPKDKAGNPIPPNTVITDTDSGKTRIYIPAGLSDNPSLSDSYKRQLLMLPEAERSAFLDGNWDALSGHMFEEFRPAGPLLSEIEKYPHARHVIAAKQLDPWLHRMIGMDWGYAHEGAAYWGCENSDGRFHVYREEVAKNRGAESWGVEIALKSLDDLRGMESGTMTLYLSPDAWDRRSDTRSVADQFCDGIRKVLGPDSVILLTDDQIPADSLSARMDEQKRLTITVRKAPNQRVAGVQYIRSLLRWKPLSEIEVEPFDTELFMRLLRTDSSRAMEYRDAYFKAQKAEVLPGLVIHSSCPKAIEMLQSRMHCDKNPEDVLKVKEDPLDNVYDGLRYLVFARTKEKNRIPFKVHFDQRMESVRRSHGGSLDGNTTVMVARKAELDFDRNSAAMTDPIFIPRAGGRRAKFAVQ